MKANETFILESNTNLLHIIRCGLYGTDIAPDNLGENYYDGLDDDEKEKRNWETEKSFDYDSYCNDIRDIAQTYFAEWAERLKKYGVLSIQPGAWFHPKYYNYANDSLELLVGMRADYKDILKARLTEIWSDKGIQQYAEDNYKSCDGFMSFTSHTLDGLLKGIEIGDERDTSAALNLIALFDGYDFESADFCFIQDVFEGLWYENYCEWGDDDEPQD